MQRLLVILASLILAACAAYDGRGLQPGVANVEDVIAQMGQPALSWQMKDGSQQLVFPRAPNGVHTFMAYFGPARIIKTTFCVCLAPAIPAGPPILPNVTNWSGSGFSATNGRDWPVSMCCSTARPGLFAPPISAPTCAGRMAWRLIAASSRAGVKSQQASGSAALQAMLSHNSLL